MGRAGEGGQAQAHRNTGARRKQTLQKARNLITEGRRRRKIDPG